VAHWSCKNHIICRIFPWGDSGCRSGWTQIKLKTAEKW